MQTTLGGAPVRCTSFTNRTKSYPIIRLSDICTGRCGFSASRAIHRRPFQQHQESLNIRAGSVAHDQNGTSLIFSYGQRLKREFTVVGTYALALTDHGQPESEPHQQRYLVARSRFCLHSLDNGQSPMCQPNQNQRSCTVWDLI
jgi:hypothetical protein